ncbi:MAG: PocR ligand-binding domain-containing protein [Oscillospiraceae bacterium]|nr:PocR ligand-binding domain-containing protein [Oscillospiraceae bacterium]
MDSVIHTDQLEELLQDFHRITGLRIVVFDRHRSELLSYPEAFPTFCTLLRATESGRRACAGCDAQACTQAAKQAGTYIYRCHAGLTEAVTPLYVGKVLAGYLLFGHIFAYEDRQAGWQSIRSCCSSHPVDPAQLQAACEAMPAMSHDYIRAAARILHMTAHHLAAEQIASVQADTDATKLDAYLNAHYTAPLTADTLCRALDMGRSKLFKLCKELYGCGPSEQLRRLRMERARALLLDSPQLPIAEIASACGYTDYNYFICMFSRHFGMPPARYRHTCHNP